MKTVERILVFRNGSIGNTLMATPALRALRESFPGATIGVVVDPTGRELLEQCPYLDHLIVYDKRGGDRGVRGYVRLVRQLRRFRPTHAVVLKRFCRNGLLSYLSGARVRAGFDTEGRAPFLTHTVRYDLGTHVSRLNLEVVGLLGATTNDTAPDVCLSSGDRAQAGAWMAGHGLEEGRFLCAHYGGISAGPPFMPPEVFAKFLTVRLDGRRVVLIGHGAKELAAASTMSTLIEGCVVGVNLPLRTAIGVLDRAAAFVGFHSGPAHLAAACRRPGIVIVPRDVREKNGARWELLWEPLRTCQVDRGMSREDWDRWIAAATHLTP
jgi:heptosyltransferase II